MKMRTTILLTTIILVLAGCNTHRIESTFDQKTQQQVCQIKNLEMTRISRVSAPRLSIKKANNNTLLCWITFYPENSGQSPLKKPGIIIKQYKNDTLTQKNQVNGTKHTFSETFGVSETKDKGLSSNTLSAVSTITAKEVWAGRSNTIQGLRNSLGEEAVSFNLTFNQFEQLLNLDKIEFLIQTQEEPIVVELDAEGIKPLIEFKHTCLTDNSKQLGK